MPPDISIERATESDMGIILNLIPYYIYEMSKSTGWECNVAGKFGGCDDSREYWRPHHCETVPASRWPSARKGHPFIVRSSTGVAGFALIQEMGDDDNVDYDVGEFFIVGKYQGQGIGRYVARMVFDKFPGRWTVRQLVSNIPAHEFWKKVVSD